MPADLVARFMQRATDMESTVERIADRRDDSGGGRALPRRAGAAAGARGAEVARGRVLAGIRRPRLGAARGSRSRRVRRRATTASASPARSARSPRPARWWCSTGARHADRDDAAAGHAHRRRARRSHRLRHGGGVRAGPQRARRAAARGQHDLRARRAPATSSRRSCSARTGRSACTSSCSASALDDRLRGAEASD